MTLFGLLPACFLLQPMSLYPAKIVACDSVLMVDGRLASYFFCM